MKDTLPQEYRNRIIEEAAEWFARLQDPAVDEDVRAGFAVWLTASAEHVQEYLSLLALHTDIGQAPRQRSVEDLIALAGQGPSENVVPLRSPMSEPWQASPPEISQTRGSRQRWYWALAASVTMALLIGGWWLRTDPDSALYATAVGEQKSVTLPDSSVVTLNAVSRLRVKYSAGYRDIQLLSGEALFDVAKNPQRPFRVLAAGSVIQAVGTRFNVRHRQDDTTVTVIEGRVKVSASAGGGTANVTPGGAEAADAWVPVAAGESARLDGPGSIDVIAVNTAANTAWRERRLVFESRPLHEAVAEFNLYNAKPLAIQDAALNDLQVSGSFYANDPQSFVLFLEAAGIARAQAQDGAILLSSQ